MGNTESLQGAERRATNLVLDREVVDGVKQLFRDEWQERGGRLKTISGLTDELLRDWLASKETLDSLEIDNTPPTTVLA